jgi:hypothetical protein
MLDPRRQRWLPYVRDLADRLHLKDWAFALDDDGPSGSDDAASICCVEGRRIGHIRLSDSFLANIPTVQRHIVTHELIHCHVDAAWSIAVEAMPAEVHPAFRRMAEHAVDGLADAFAPLMPLPKFAKS